MCNVSIDTANSGLFIRLLANNWYVEKLWGAQHLPRDRSPMFQFIGTLAHEKQRQERLWNPITGRGVSLVSDPTKTGECETGPKNDLGVPRRDNHVPYFNIYVILLELMFTL